MQSFDLSGELTSGGTLLMRESPTQLSIAVTSVEKQGEELFWTESELDIWTDLSFDGGVTWTPSGQSVPEPSGLVALSSAVLLAAAKRRRRPTTRQGNQA